MEKTMDRFQKFLIATLAVAGLFTLPASAQQFPSVTDRILSGETASAVVATDSDQALVCVYLGTSGSGFITVAATTLLFESPNNSTANTHIECDASIAADGSRNGIIDFTVAACDTWTEILNIVNKPESDFRCAILNALGSDTLASGELTTVTNGAADPPTGYAIKWDTDVNLTLTQMVAPLEYALPDKYFSVAPGASAGRGNPFFGMRGYLRSAYTQSTYAGGSSSTAVLSVLGEYLPYTAAPGTAGVPVRTGLTYRETATTLWTAANGATTVAKVLGGCDTPATACDPAWGEFIQGRKNEKLLVRMTNTTAGEMDSATLGVNGYFYPWQ